MALIVVINEPHHSGVISKFDYGFGCMDGYAVMGEEGVEGWAEYTPLGRSGVQDNI